MLYDFVEKGAPLEVPGVETIIPCIQREIERARLEGVPVFYLCDGHEEDDPEFAAWPPHAVRGSRGAEIIAELVPRPEDVIIYKTTYSSFYNTELEDMLRKFGATRLTITGLCTEICVLYTAVDAYMRGFEVTVPDGCTKGLTEEDHRFALKQIRHILKPAQVASSG
ncbi:MAG: cysteine hydrolase [Candidatus Omnitrophica bacterium]|nr:cysteine hydrolase [Candidatus Omnitrophota bacterium]